MSTNILETETFSITRFFGGRYRGVCYQISVAGSPGYVQLTRDEAVLLRSALTDELFGDPSEATPSKENEMVGSTGRIHKKTHDCETAGCRPAPPTMPYGAGAQNFAVKTYAETADQIRAATFVGTDKFVQTDTQQLPASVPEGVQGKEPKTFEEYWEIGRPDIRHLSSIQQIKLAEVRSAFSAGQVSGEAAGRRSAIAELQEWARGEGVRYWDVLVEKCAELLERTK